MDVDEALPSVEVSSASAEAWSIDGRGFAFEAALAEPFPLGGYVELATEDGRTYLGQVTGERVEVRPGAVAGADRRVVLGAGRLLARLEGDDAAAAPGTSDTFGTAHVSVASAAALRRYRRSEGLVIGRHRLARDATPAALATKGFNRHTFLCGQSGSGKTYTLGVVLERLLLHTSLQLVLLDPNSDYVRLDTLRRELPADAPDGLSDRWSSLVRGLRVFGPEAGRPLRVLFGRLPHRTQALVLGLDPVADPEGYAVFRRVAGSFAGTEYSLSQLVGAAAATLDEPARRLALRVRALGVDEWSVWAEPGATTVGDELGDDWRAAILDLGGLPSAEERAVLSATVLDALWERRGEHVPRLIVVDEAHNVCPSDPVGPHQALAVDQAVRIAAEGRKFGLYLLLSTQQPQKLHPRVLSQCDNLLLMRMNSAADIARLAETFSFVPEAFLARSPAFGLGQGLAAGRIAPDPVFFQTGGRWTEEGGSDLPTTWATAPR